MVFGPLLGGALRPLFGGGAVAAVPTLNLTCVTTGPDTLTLLSLGVNAGKTVVVDWGDGSSNAYTGVAQRTHAYAGAGTWPIKFTNRNDIYKIDFRDVKLFGTINAGNPFPIGLTYLYLAGHPQGITVEAGSIGPLTELLTLYLYGYGAAKTLQAGELTALTKLNDLTFYVATLPVGIGNEITSLAGSLTRLTIGNSSQTIAAGVFGQLVNLVYLYVFSATNFTIGAGEIGGLTKLQQLIYNAVPNATMNSGEICSLSATLSSVAIANCANVTLGAGDIAALTKLTTLAVNNCPKIATQTSFPNTITNIQYVNALSAANVDAVLAGVWGNKANFTGAAPILNLLGGSNAAPNGTYQDPSPANPSTGKEYKYCLINDIPSVGPAWSVTTA